jgi:hypothetical protein
MSPFQGDHAGSNPADATKFEIVEARGFMLPCSETGRDDKASTPNSGGTPRPEKQKTHSHQGSPKGYEANSMSKPSAGGTVRPK